MGKIEEMNRIVDMTMDLYRTDKEFLIHCLQVYYDKLFPYADIFKWMSYGHDGKHPGCDHSYAGRREFSFTLGNDTDMRFQSFHTCAEMENAIKEKCPLKIDIGAVYGQRGPEERELIFDIDMSDYDHVRNCCSGATACPKCWPLMTVAIKVIDMGLRDDLGFEHILWVFSGTIGVQCWVCDGKARRLDNEQRAAIADYFRLYKDSENSQKKVSLVGQALHPFQSRSYTEVLKSFFEDKLLLMQNLLQNEESCAKILEMIPDESITSELSRKWTDNKCSKENINITRWEQLKRSLQSGKQKAPELHRCVEEIIFAFTYPRLNMEVSTHMNHLLKAPFCIHPDPEQGNVCVPIDPNRCEEFSPPLAPKADQLFGHLITGFTSMEMEDDLDKTALGRYFSSIRYFRSSFLSPLLKSCEEEIEATYNMKTRQRKNTMLLGHLLL